MPNVDEIRVMMKMIGKKIPDHVTNKDIIPNITKDQHLIKNAISNVGVGLNVY